MSCLSQWWNTQAASGAAPSCPRCKTVVKTVDVHELPVHSLLDVQDAAAPRVSDAAADDDPSLVLDASGAPAQFAIAYIAGVHVTGVNMALYKVVYRLKDCEPDEERSSWQRLSAMVETMPAVRDFHKRWALPDLGVLPVGFKWEHAVPVRLRRLNLWQCSFPDCTVRMKEEHNVRHHAGSVHAGLRGNLRAGTWDCDMCGQHCSTKTNQKKHKKRKHAEIIQPPPIGHNAAPAADM